MKGSLTFGLFLWMKGFAMTILSRTLVGASIVALLMAGSASAFTSRDGTRVNPLSEGRFEVVPRAGGVGRDYWCAAGDYAQRALKAPWAAQLYISRSRGPSETTNKRSAVQFTLRADLAGGPEKGDLGSVNSLARGDNMRVQEAFRYCSQLPTGF